jgi:hypothetical protein
MRLFPRKGEQGQCCDRPGVGCRFTRP